MRKLSGGLVVSLLCLAGVALDVSPPTVQAAPMTGVVFQTPQRVFDALRVDTNRIILPLVNPVSLQVLLQITIVPNLTGPSGLLLSHDCDATPNPQTDGVLPIDSLTGQVSNQVFAPVSNQGAICLTATVPALRLVIDVEGWANAAGSTVSYVDTPFTFATTILGPVAAQPIDFSSLGVPANAAGVAVWLDAFSSTDGFATVFPCNQPKPPTGSVSWTADQPTTGLVAGVATSGSQLCISVSDAASVDVSLDGYYSPTAVPTPTSAPQIRYSPERAPGFVGVTPTRLFDTRETHTPVAAGQPFHLDLSSQLPPETTAVVMNVTVTNPAAAGFVSVYPCDGPQPPVSNLNYVAGQTVPNLVTVDAGFTLELCFFSLQTTNLIADLAGYYVLGGGDGFTPAPPVRLFDTRGGPKRAAGSTFDFDMSPFVGADATSVVLNLTATEVAGPGFVTVYPCDQTLPVASNLNIVAGQTVPNLVTVRLAPNRHICFFTSAATQLLSDLAGWYAPSSASGFLAVPPDRWADTRDVFSEPLLPGDILGLGFDAIVGATAIVFNATATETQAAGFLTAFPCIQPDPPNASNVNFVAGQTVPNMVIAATAGGDVCIFTSAGTHWIVDIGGFFTDQPLFVTFFPPGTDNT